MESEFNTDQRLQAIKHWIVKECYLQPISWEAMVGAASFRRYFRIRTESESFVIMDAPPELEQIHGYVAIAKKLRELGLFTPEILMSDFDKGFLLITDFGDTTYLRGLNPTNAQQLYGRALKALAVLQSCRYVPGKEIPLFSSEWMWQEWAWHKEWFLHKLLDVSLTGIEKPLDECYAYIVASALSQPQVFMHRDYHAGNLMVLPNQQVGILDFQDAFIGPVTYDLVSLLRDCYIDWPDSEVRQWALSYWQALPDVLPAASQEEFLRLFDFMGLQRHLKALFTFARKHVRDQQSQYLQAVPRTLNYLLQVSAIYPELTALHEFLEHKIKERVKKLCAR